MSSFHGKQSARTILHLFAALIISGFMLVQTCGPAFAGTTGILSGIATDSATQAPLANVRVTAVAPTGRYSATTNNKGFYSIVGVAPDAYAVSFNLSGYEPVSVPGQNVFADQVTTVSTTLTKSLRTIAHVTSRSAGGAFQPTQPTDTYNVTPHQIQTIQGNSLNTNESNLITSLPGASLDSSGYPVIRGGRENEENFEFEGIPYTDAFTTQFTNTLAAPGLGLQSAQLTPGLGDASQDNYGTGTFNLIAKRGAYPGFATFQGALGGPAFRHILDGEWGFASPNGRFSAYLTFINNYQGRAYNTLSSNCQSLGTCWSRYYQADREGVGNLVYKFGRDNNMQLQFFVDLAQHDLLFGASGAPGFNTCFKSCDPFFLQYALQTTLGLSAPPLTAKSGCVSALNCAGYTAPPICPPAPASCASLLNAYSNVQLLQSMLNLQKGQTAINETLAQDGNRPPQSYHQPNNAIKFGYLWQIDSSTNLQAMIFHTDAVVYFDWPQASGYSTSGFNAFDLLQGGKRTGGKIDLVKQLSDKNLLKVGTSYQYLTPVYDQVAPNYGIFNVSAFGTNFEFPDFIPQANCPADYGGPGSPVCGYIYQFGNVATRQTVPNSYESSSTHRNDWAFYADDTWSPNDKLKVEGGLRVDAVNYQIPPPSIDPATCTSLYLPQYLTNPNGTLQSTPSTNPNTQTFDPTGAPLILDVNGNPQFGRCPVAVFPQYTNQSKKPIVPEPILSATYRLGANDSVRASWGRSVEFPNLASVDWTANPGYFGGPNGAFFNIPGYGHNCGANGDQACVNYAEQLYWENAQVTVSNVPLQPLRPVVFTNVDFSWEHQFTRGFMNGVNFKVTPWYRKAHDEVALVSTVKLQGGVPLLDPITGSPLLNPPLGNNLGINQADGVEMQFTKEQTYGLSGQVSFTYQNELTSVIPGSANEDFYPQIPAASLALGNVYRAGTLSPFLAAFDFSYQTHSGWRINPQTTWNIGYPLSPGLLAAGFINGQPFNVPYTNASAAAVQALSATTVDQFVDPMNPGSFFKPNVAATRGIPVTSAAGGKLSHPSSITNLTIEYNAPKTWSAGVDVFNLFGALYGGPSLNGRWQPLANGISGPLTGQSSTGLAFPQFVPLNTVGDYGTLRHGRNAYLDTPSGIRSYYVYFTVKM
jgi:hypothetical protein